MKESSLLAVLGMGLVGAIGIAIFLKRGSSDDLGGLGGGSGSGAGGPTGTSVTDPTIAQPFESGGGSGAMERSSSGSTSPFLAAYDREMQAPGGRSSSTYDLAPIAGPLGFVSAAPTSALSSGGAPASSVRSPRPQQTVADPVKVNLPAPGSNVFAAQNLAPAISSPGPSASARFEPAGTVQDAARAAMERKADRFEASAASAPAFTAPASAAQMHVPNTAVARASQAVAAAASPAARAIASVGSAAAAPFQAWKTKAERYER